MGEGQFSGTRSDYVYTTDTGAKYVIEMDDTLGTQPNNGLTVFDPANPGTATPKPNKFNLRGVYWQGTAAGYEGKRKFLVCGTLAATLYASNLRQTVSVDGVAGVTTGRKGESMSF